MDSVIYTLRKKIDELTTELEKVRLPNLLGVESPEVAELKKQIEDHEKAIDLINAVSQWRKNYP